MTDPYVDAVEKLIDQISEPMKIYALAILLRQKIISAQLMDSSLTDAEMDAWLEAYVWAAERGLVK